MATEEKTKRIDCTSCGAPVPIRLPDKTQSIACDYCGSVLDTTSEDYKIIAKFARDTKIQPLIELGSRGTFEGQEFELVGFLRKKDNHGGSWEEYLLFNPYLGFRYLSQWQGHWNYIRMLRGFPFDSSGRPVLPQNLPTRAVKGREKFKYFFGYKAQVTYVLGEFNWKVKKGETVTVADYIDPPLFLSGEFSSREAVWARGQYTDRKKIRKAFGLKDKLPKPRHVAPNQVNPFKAKFWLGLLFALTLTIVISVFGGIYEDEAEQKQLFNKRFDVSLLRTKPKRQGRETFKDFELVMGNLEIPAGKKKNFEFKINTNLSNRWMFLTFFLMNEKTQKGYSFSKLVSFYSGYSDGEYWSEGSKSESFMTDPLPPGKYYTLLVGQTNDMRRARATLTVKRDVISWGYAGMMIAGLWFPLVYYFIRRKMFEQSRNS